MKTTKRLDEALNKLYTAFHNGTLNAECCNNCAVGNICDNTDSWKYLSDSPGSLKLNYIGQVHQGLGRKFHGYTPSELLNIEAEFLKGCGYILPLNHKNPKPKDPTSQETLFNGLCTAVEYLCFLDGIQNVMDYYPLLQQEVKANPKLETIY